MHYIVFDLEWNQPLSHRSMQFRKYGGELMFDLIQIGAVKLDEGRRMVGSFNQFIAPECYRKLHPRISRITGITQDDVKDAPGFREAFERFVSWCGEDFSLITWGCDDISVFQQNMRFYLDDKREMPPVFDLQKLYGVLEGATKNRAGLQSALQRHGIAISQEHPLHSAVDDAYYTALVFQRMPEAEAIYQHPQKVRELQPAATRQQGRQVDDLRFTSIAQAISSRPALEPNCPVCGKRMKVPEGYAPQRDQSWRALADCPDHGLVFVDLILTVSPQGKPSVRRSAILSEQQNTAYVRTKHLQWAQKVAQALPKEVSA